MYQHLLLWSYAQRSKKWGNPHIMLQMALPKGITFEFLIQWDLNPIVNHINSTPRQSLDGRTPHDAVLKSFGGSTLKANQLWQIAPDKGNLIHKLIHFYH